MIVCFFLLINYNNFIRKNREVLKVFIRIGIVKFSNSIKANMFLAVWKTDILPVLKKDSKMLEIIFLDIGEGKLLAIAKYPSEEDFNKTNKWIYPLISKNVKELDGVFESIPGGVLLHWYREDYT
tara:strand:- start:89 stop:463 length:375 start_codon:yes stop_codon:yes gene_type:complete